MNWVVTVTLHVILFVIFNQFYKIATRKMVSAGALTICLELMATIVAVFEIPFFKIKVPHDPKVWLLLGLAVVFYTVNDRLNTTVRAGLEASTFGIISQLSTGFLTISGFVFFKDEFVWMKFIGALLIILSNIFIFYKPGQGKPNKYVILGVIANACFAGALFLDANICSQFNLGFYQIISLGVPAILIMIGERISPKALIAELKAGDKPVMIITAASWTLAIMFQLISFQIGKISVVTPLMSLTVILNVIIGYIFLKERDDLVKKIIASAIIIAGIVMINI